MPRVRWATGGRGWSTLSGVRRGSVTSGGPSGTVAQPHCPPWPCPPRPIAGGVPDPAEDFSGACEQAGK